jgi:hypothetical protein
LDCCCAPPNSGVPPPPNSGVPVVPNADCCWVPLVEFPHASPDPKLPAALENPIPPDCLPNILFTTLQLVLKMKFNAGDSLWLRPNSFWLLKDRSI